MILFSPATVPALLSIHIRSSPQLYPTEKSSLAIVNTLFLLSKNPTQIAMFEGMVSVGIEFIYLKNIW